MLLPSEMMMLLMRFAVTLLLLLVDVSDAVTRLVELNGRTACAGLTHGNVKADYTSAGGQLKMLEDHYRTCQIVFGNLELQFIDEGDQLPGNLTLRFESIEEVTGYISIDDLRVIERIELPNLRAIWGEHLLKNRAAIGINRCRDCRAVSMPQLRVVRRGDIIVNASPNLCHMQLVDWRQVLHDDKQKIVLGNPDSCAGARCAGRCAHCWGASQNDCQLIYRDGCAKQCLNDMCFRPNDSNACCHYSCAGGCTGPTNRDCLGGCAAFRQDGACVDQCPPMMLYNPTTMMKEVNARGRYMYYNYCVKKCPAHTLIDENACVITCPTGSAPNDAGECRECPGNRCQITCRLHEKGLDNTEHLTSANIDAIAGCTELDGNLEIRADSLRPSSATVLLNNGSMATVHAINEADLAPYFSSLRRIYGYLLVNTKYCDDCLTSLSFLRNLEMIDGRAMHSTASLVITHNPSLTTLGLKSLKNISRGGVAIKYNPKLCLANTINFDSITAGISDVDMANNSVNCGTCHQMCNSTLGCWGYTASDCYKCQFYEYQDSCVESCDVTLNRYSPDDLTCVDCHDQCADGCSGPTEHDCTRCATVRHPTSGACVTDCPIGTYNNAGVCSTCHPSCDRQGCTGGSPHLGAGGCTSCAWSVFVDGGVNERRCSTKRCDQLTPPHYSSSPRAFNISSDDVPVCVQCSHLCDTCVGAGATTDVCKCKHARAINSEGVGQCVHQCDSELHFIITSTECGICSSVCAGGCSGPLATDCTDCRFFKYQTSDNRTNCTNGRTCPDGLQEMDAWCLTAAAYEMAVTENDEKRARIKQRMMLALVSAGALALALLVMGAIAYMYRHRWYVQRKLYELPMDELPDGDDEANRAQLRLISDQELKRGQVLGSGAFGVVFQGVWTPRGEKVCIPVAIKEVQSGATTENEMLEEAGIMASMQHQHLVRLVGVCLSGRLMLVSALMPLGNLGDFVRANKKKIGAGVMLRWCDQIAQGMAYLEMRRLVHRDLAARNVLVQTATHVRVTDFGLAKMLQRDQSAIIVEGRVPVKWLAMECIKQRVFTHQSDVWAFGITVWELLTFGDRPYASTPIQKIPELLERGERLPQPSSASLDLYMLLIRCWMVDASSRPTFAELHRILADWLREPHRYIVLHEQSKELEPATTDAREAIRHLLDDATTNTLLSADDYFEADRYHSDPTGAAAKQAAKQQIAMVANDNYVVPVSAVDRPSYYNESRDAYEQPRDRSERETAL